MNKIIESKKKQVLSVQEFLLNANRSNENHDSTQEPCFIGSVQNDLIMNHKELPDIPESLNRHIKIMYECIGNPDIEIYIGEWTIMSLNRSLERYEQYCKDGQKSVFDIGFKYLGLGHIMVLSCDLDNHLLFKRNDGGSNDIDREDHYKRILNYYSDNYHHVYFRQWKEEILNK